MIMQNAWINHLHVGVIALFHCSQELEKLGLDETTDLYVREIPVEYQAVQGLLPALWKEHNPQVLQNNHFFLLCLTQTITKIQRLACYLVFCE